MLDSSRELAAGAGIECRQVTSGIDALLDADELFLTNSLVEIAPVSAVAGLMFAAPGPVTNLLHTRYRVLVSEATRRIGQRRRSRAGLESSTDFAPSTFSSP